MSLSPLGTEYTEVGPDRPARSLRLPEVRGRFLLEAQLQYIRMGTALPANKFSYHLI